MPADFTLSDYLFGGMTQGFAAKLLNAFALHQANILTVEGDNAVSIFRLHGSGAEDDTAILQAGSGLSCMILNRTLWVGGYRTVIDEDAGGLVVELPAESISYIYLRKDQTFYLASSVADPHPTDACFVGVAVTNAETCLSVDDSGADRMLNLSAFKALLDLCRSAIGAAYFGDTPPSDIDARLTEVETHTSGDETLWARLRRDVDNDQTIQEYVKEQIDAIPAGGGGGGSTGGGGGAVVVPDFFDWPLINFALSVLRLTEYVDPDYPSVLKNLCVIVWGVYGDGTAREDTTLTPNYVDPSSTWRPVA